MERKTAGHEYFFSYDTRGSEEGTWSAPPSAQLNLLGLAWNSTAGLMGLRSWLGCQGNMLLQEQVVTCACCFARESTRRTKVTLPSYRTLAAHPLGSFLWLLSITCQEHLSREFCLLVTYRPYIAIRAWKCAMEITASGNPFLSLFSLAHKLRMLNDPLH